MRISRRGRPSHQILHFGVAGFLALASLLILSWPFSGFSASLPDTSTFLDPLPSSAANDNKNAASENAWKGRLPISDLDENAAITHALDRLGYGPRPGDLQRIRQMGLETWINQQLHPETVPDKPAQDRLLQYSTLSLSSSALMNMYPRPNVAAKRMGVTEEEYNKRLQDLLHPPQGMRAAADPRPQTILNELTMAKLTRAVYSERQLQEQLTDFWFNHFNIFVYKDQDIYLVSSFERDAIRPYLFGKFRDMLGATAHHPAMLIYLDNWLSGDPGAVEHAKHASPVERRTWKDLPGLGNKSGLNENYGRELMELHTLGVDGGYTQQDVIQAAKCFTGWTVRDPGARPDFVFDYRIHDPAPKKVLGKTFKHGGVRDGEEVLDLLVKQKAAAHHLSYQLAEHFVSDNPPPALVDRMAKAFEKSKGDLRETVRTMIYSPEFWSRDSYRAKIKTPFELVASSARALGADVDSPTPLVNWVARIGEPLYQCQPPTGYKDNMETWVNTGALLNRLNFALTLATNRLRGAEVDLASRLGEDVQTDPKRAIVRAVDTFLGGQISAGTRATIEQQSESPQVLHAKLDDPIRKIDLGVITGLVLGAPEFQRR
ncbi:MAG TPA: DUF1800 domain-containing protein [Candidatus Acidoferrales bacterium]|nr:DUF1800 domain-containing protein [Candidatus Acidoferrales bacterium]